MPVGATLAVAGVGAVSSVAGSRATSSAARHAQASAEDISDRQIALYRDIFNKQQANFEPFRRLELQRANLLGSFFGLTPEGGQAGQQTQQQQLLSSASPQAISAGQNFINQPANNDVLNAFNNISNRDRQFVMDQGFDSNRDGQLSAGEFGNFHFDRHGRAEGRTGFEAVTQAQPQGQPSPVATPVSEAPGFNNLPAPEVIQDPRNALAGQGGPRPLFDPSIAGANAINNSVFAAQGQTGFNREKDAIDANLAKQGVVFSGARLQAVEDAQQRAGGNVLSQFFNVLAGFPTAGPATQAQAQSGSQFASGVGNSLGNLGLAQQQSAFQQGKAKSDMFGNLATSAGSAIGAFNLGG
ncbi:MAG: hypothetical protein JKY52_08590 [Flavobacteriales bacterium]|nr:hypothetical protein [Flavobacteriales bacterium]